MGEKNRMNKVIFFTDLKQLEKALGFFDLKEFANQKIPVKMHMGEMNNKYYPQPDFTKQVIDVLKTIQAEPYLFDTTVAYPGPRRTKAGYKKLARLHGFTEQKVGCPVVIDDKGIPIQIEGRAFDVAEHLVSSTHIFSLTHVKGHIQTGMGGAIKNFGMGGVTRETKIRIHQGSRPQYTKDLCTYCGVCAELCPFDAIKVKDKVWNYNNRACFGCGVCVDACKNKALHYKDADLQYLIACAAKACVDKKQVLYLNEVKRIARGCDCDPFAGPIICPDIGYLIADDPVAIDKASLDLIDQVKKDVFQKINKIDPYKQIRFGEQIGLGSSSYELIKV
jgi:uncharacterized protein